MVIPQSRLDQLGIDNCYYERLSPSDVSAYRLGQREVTVFYEKPKKGFSFGCTPEDVVHLLSLIPGVDVRLIDIIVFRQPTRKQARLSSVWGRLLHFARIRKSVGSAIYLEAQEVGLNIRWPKKLSLVDQAELDRLRLDGHKFSECKRYFTTKLTEQAIRNTLLYRTLLHELGHWVQYERDILNESSALSDDPDVSYQLYFAQPNQQRESFAHRYADEMRKKLQNLGVIPFESINPQEPDTM